MSTPVLLVAPNGGGGGAQRVLGALARHLPSHGFEPHAVVFRDGVLETWLRDAGVPVERVPMGRLRHPQDLVRTVGGIRRAGRAAKAELLIDNMSIGHIYGGLAAATMRVPSIMWQQIIPGQDLGGPKMSRPIIEKVAARVPSAAVVVNSQTSAAAQRQLNPRQHVVEVNAGIDVEAARARIGCGRALRHAMGWDDKTVIGIVGWLIPWKGQDLFLRAAAELAPHWPDAHFVVVGGPGDSEGDAEYAAGLPRLAAQLGIDDRVTFAGPRDDVADWFDAFDVAVHASWGAPFELVVVEAMVMGTPVVATSYGGTSDVIVRDGVTGLLVAPGDSSAIAAAIERYLRDPCEAAAIAAAGQAHAAQFSEARMTERFAAVMDEVLGR